MDPPIASDGPLENKKRVRALNLKACRTIHPHAAKLACTIIASTCTVTFDLLSVVKCGLSHSHRHHSGSTPSTLPNSIYLFENASIYCRGGIEGSQRLH